MSRPLTAQGFTLIEVMISMTILAFISIGIFQAQTQTFRLRESLSAEAEFFNAVRLSMDILGRDISSIYSPSLIRLAPQNKDEAKEPSEILQRVMTSDAGHTSAFWLGATDESGIRPSRFNGSTNKVSFVTLSHARIYRDSAESNFSKISYELARDDENTSGSTYVLIRTESANAFDDDDRRDRKYQRRYPILRGIKKLTYRYWQKSRDRWDSSWDNDKEEYKEKFPDIIEATLEVEGPQRLSFEGVLKFRPEVPLNGTPVSL